jgi:site-specific DNA-methyltransferase (adenine-specific)
MDRERFEKELARQRSLSNLKVGNKLPTVSHDTTGETGRTRDKIAKESGLSPATYARVKKIIESGDKLTKEKLRSGKAKIGTEYKKIVFEEKRQGYRAKSLAIPYLAVDGLQLINGDFREKCKTIPDNSIDIIFTDPPYALEDLPLYRDLGELAMRVLKDGSSLITYVGHHLVSEAIGYLRQAGIENVWLIAIKQSGPKAKIFKNNIHVNWKPLLWFSKGSRAENKGNVINDLIESESPPDKSLHEWAQSTVEAKYLIEYLTVEGQTVLDPFMGSGTTGIAAMNLGRKFIGIEIDENRFNVARGRIAEKVEMLKNNNDAATTSADSS